MPQFEIFPGKTHHCAEMGREIMRWYEAFEKWLAVQMALEVDARGNPR